VDVARAAQALAPRVAPFFLKWKEFLKYSIFNQKYFNTVFLPQNAQK
jgi:hypothetical protein